MISKKESENIFYKPKVVRVEPKVIAAEQHEDAAVDNNPMEELANEIDFLLSGFANISEEYQRLLNVLIKRADIRNISLDVKGLAESDQAISNALSKLYGKQPNSLSYSAYVDLLKHEYTVSAAHIAKSIDTDNTYDIDEILKSSDINNNPIIQSISVIKRAYKKYMLEQDAYDLLKAENIVKKMADSQSAYSAVDNADTLVDGEKITDRRPIDHNKKNKVNSIIRDCIPCAERNIGILEKFTKSKVLNDFLKMMFNRYFNLLLSIARMKLSIYGVYFTNDICALINYLSNIICVPDLRAMTILLKSMVIKVKALIKEMYGDYGFGIAGEPFAAFITAGMDSLMSLLNRLMTMVFSSIDCILNSIRIQLYKLNATEEIDELNAELGYDTNLATDTDITGRFNVPELNDFFVTLRESKESMEASVYSIIDQMNKKLLGEDESEEKALTLFDTLDKHTRLISLLQEITSIKEAYGNSLNPNDWDKLKKSICKAASARYPWLEAISEDLLGLRESVEDIIDGRNDNNDDNDDNNSNKDDEVILIDDTLDRDLIEDDLLDILDDDEFKDLFDKYYDSDKDIQNNRSSWDDDLINRYKTTTDNIKNTLYKINNTTNDSPTVISLPVVRISFDDCLRSADLFTATKSEIDAWINKTIS